MCNLQLNVFKTGMELSATLIDVSKAQGLNGLDGILTKTDPGGMLERTDYRS